MWPLPTPLPLAQSTWPPPTPPVPCDNCLGTGAFLVGFVAVPLFICLVIVLCCCVFRCRRGSV